MLVTHQHMAVSTDPLPCQYLTFEGCTYGVSRYYRVSEDQNHRIHLYVLWSLPLPIKSSIFSHIGPTVMPQPNPNYLPNTQLLKPGVGLRFPHVSISQWASSFSMSLGEDGHIWTQNTALYKHPYWFRTELNSKCSRCRSSHCFRISMGDK